MIFASIEYSSSENYPARILFLIVFFVSCVQLPLFDALPQNLRLICNKLLLPTCILLLIVWQIALFRNWSHCTTKRLKLFGHIDMTVSGAMSSALNNIILLLIIFCISAYRRPSNLVLIKSSTEILTMAKEESIKLRAMDTVDNNISDQCREPDIVQVILNRMKSNIGLKNKS